MNIIQSYAPALAEQNKTWKFIELWVNPVLFPPEILMLVGDSFACTFGARDGTCHIFNPTFAKLSVIMEIFTFKGSSTVTELLEQAIAQLKVLPTNEQDTIATIILEEIEDDRRWDESFSRSPNILAKLAASAMAEYHVFDIDLSDRRFRQENFCGSQTPIILVG